MLNDIVKRATTPPLNAYLTATFATLSKHKANGAFDHHRALRLLRNNIRDIAPNEQLTSVQRDDIALRLLRHWQKNV